MNFYKGYPLRKLKISDYILMWLASPILFPIFTSLMFGIVYALMNLDLPVNELENNILNLEGTMVAVGFIGSLILSMIIIAAKKIPVLNRKRLKKNEYVLIPGLDKNDWRFLSWYVPVSYVLFNLGSIALEYIIGEGELVNQEAVESMVSNTPLWLTFIIIVVAAPLVEEWLFRGVSFFRKEHNDVSWATVIFTSLLFGLVHVPTSIVAVYTYVGMGLLFGYAAKKTKAVEAAIFFHFVNNLIGFILLVITR